MELNKSNFNESATSIKKQDVPNATETMFVGIASLVFCGMGPILGVIALVISKKGKTEYEANPNMYNETTYKNLKIGRTCGIAGIVVGVLFWLFYILLMVFSIASSAMRW